MGEDYNYNLNHNQLDQHVVLAGTALVIGLISIPLCFFLNLGTVVGGIAIILALLSKGNMEKLLPQAKKALIYGTLGVVIGYGVFVYDVHAVFTNPEYRRQLNVMSQQMNGVSFDDMLKDLGITIDN
ncbi:MAG: hypothetical protein IJU77_13310 [Butyrivibrio sp.]|nr:hypothetical protein [Butyrivibrio sp.]